MSVRQIADRAGIVKVAVDVRDEGHRHESRVLVDGPLHVVDVDRPVAVFDDAELQPFGFERLIHVERCLEVQLVEHDVATAPGQIHSHDDDVFAVGRVLDECDLVRLRADERGEAPLQILLLVLAEIGAALASALHPERDVLLQRTRCGQTHRVDRSGVQIRLGRGDWKVRSNRGGEHSFLRRSRRKSGAARRGEGGGAEEKVPTVDCHDDLREDMCQTVVFSLLKIEPEPELLPSLVERRQRLSEAG